MVRIIESKSTEKNCNNYTLFYQLSIFGYYVRNEFLKSTFFATKSQIRKVGFYIFDVI